MRLSAVQGWRQAGTAIGTWRTSSYTSYNGNCVEVGDLPTGRIGIRDTKNRGGEVLNFSPAEWSSFLSDVRNGEIDRKPR